MSITTYAQLITAIGNYAIRTDTATLAPEYIRLGEAMLNRRLRCRDMVTLFEGEIIDTLTPLPADFAGMRSLRLQSGAYTKLEPVTVDHMDELKAKPDVSGAPTAYTIVGRYFETYPVPPSTDTTPYRGYYYKLLCSLSTSNPCNWLLEKWPDAYLYASLIHFGIRAQDERLPLWTSALSNILTEIHESERSDVGDRLTPQNGVYNP